MYKEKFVLNYFEKMIKKIEDLKIIKRDLKMEEVENKVITLIGPRRVGKTYYLLDYLKNKYKKFIYLNFESIELKYLEPLEVLEVISLFKSSFFETDVILLDEIQNIKNWESLARTLIDEEYRIFITGSSSKLLSKEIATQLRGRSLSYLLLPFSFKEFLKTKEFNKKILSLDNISKIKSFLLEYLEFGGFPEIVLTKDFDKKEILIKNYIDLLFLKDFVERFEIRNLEIGRFIFEFLLQNFSSEISINKVVNHIYSLFKLKSKNTIYEYFNFIEDTLNFFFVEKFDFSVYKRKTWPKKVYLCDTGLSLPFRFTRDIGKLMENTVFLHLKRQENQKPFQEIYYYKTKNNKEIDFLIKEKNKIQLIEVAYEFDEEHKKKLMKAMDELKLKESICITWDEEDEVGEKGKKIKLIPLWKWLLKE
jgi:predicted AAA+ superfamily ATPase